MSWIRIIKSILIKITRNSEACHCGSFQKSPGNWQTGKQYKKSIGNNIIKRQKRKDLRFIGHGLRVLSELRKLKHLARFT